MNVGDKKVYCLAKDGQDIDDDKHSTSTDGTFALRRDQQSSADQVQLIELYRAGNDYAKRKLRAENMQRVIDVVKCYANRGVTFLDLILAGNQGLDQALDKFVPEEGISFPVFAEQCICENIEHAIMGRGNQASRALNARHVDSPTPYHFVIKPLNDYGRR
jgi:DNA-directed RNA polymerase sigma subunit (sigma70/sigma32)